MLLLLSAVTLVHAPHVVAQTVTTRATDLLTEPGGRPVATIVAGASVQPGRARGEFTEVTIHGFVSAGLLAGPRESFPLSVRGDGTRLRAAANTGAPILAEMRSGMGLMRIAARGQWVEVRRTGWINSAALAAVSTAASPRADQAADTAGAHRDLGPAAAQMPTALAPRELMIDDRVPLRAAPDGGTLATLETGTPLTPLARERGWIRVRVEGWVPEGAVTAADTALRASLSAADLRADPAGTRGKLVRWNVQVLALQTADPLRPDLAPDEPYLLARGPGSENALLYLAVPPSLLNVARQIPALSEVTITARVRTGRSEPVGVPVLDLLVLARR